MTTRGSDIKPRILRALATGPLYRPTLELVIGSSARDTRIALQSLLAEGKVEIATEIGPDTYRLKP